MSASLHGARRHIDLPAFYYHSHFSEFLRFVDTHYRHCFATEHAAFIADFEALSYSAQCLYARLANRKGRLFAVRRLSYPEIGNLSAPLSELRAKRWLSSPRSDHYADVLRYLPRDRLSRHLRARLPGTPRSLRKSDLITLARSNLDAHAFLTGLDLDGLVVMARWNALHYLLYLYFGKIEDSLTQFTMRDLGLVRTQEFNEHFEPRFGELDEAQENYYFAARLDRLKRQPETVADELLREIPCWGEPNYANAARLRDRLACRIGRHYETLKDSDSALTAYRSGESGQCNERLVRLLLARGERDAARRFLEACQENPRSLEEWLFASDVHERKFGGKRTSLLTDTLREAEVIDIDESLSASAENAAISYFTGLGVPAYRAENSLWKTLFGLMFWEELYGGKAPALHSPFELMPASLEDGSFHARHRSAIDRKLAGLFDLPAARRHLLKVSTRFYGVPNALFRWRRNVTETLFALLENAPPAAVGAVLLRMCNDFTGNRYGYPDLLLVEDGIARLVEIKAEGDQLRRNQMARLSQLRADGFRADVIRVRWILDPDREYVVVDVETTGGSGEMHRITEIGAIKLRNGRVVDRFETLLNPQRAIPPNIRRLTGITQQMVADAPLFLDIADDLESFLGDAVFVAHNVNFDYRFITQEFARAGRSFRAAKLCTCASMRKLFPGHNSYSLDSLCRTFGIPLERHHRAMCDAEAAAELLLMINDKRRELFDVPAA